MAKVYNIDPHPKAPPPAKTRFTLRWLVIGAAGLAAGTAGFAAWQTLRHESAPGSSRSTPPAPAKATAQAASATARHPQPQSGSFNQRPGAVPGTPGLSAASPQGNVIASPATAGMAPRHQVGTHPQIVRTSPPMPGQQPLFNHAPPMGATPQSSPLQASAQDLIARMKPSVVLVLSQDRFGDISSGTGFIVGANQVATCYHVIQGALRIMVITADGRQFGVYAGPFDTANDVAVLTTNAVLSPSVTLGNSDAAREGDEIAVSGYPVVTKLLELGYVPTSSTSRGTLSAKRTRVDLVGTVNELQIDAPINAGNSGGPVYSLRDGAVIGLASSKLVREQGIGFASPVNTLRRLLGR